MVWSGRTKNGPQGVSRTQAPTATATSSSTTPNTVEPLIEPGRILWDQTPITRAMGMVQRIENTPQALSLREFTTTRAIAAMAMVITRMIATAVADAVTPLTCSRAMLASERPPLRTEATRITKSCTPPASTEPSSSQRKPGA